SQPGVTRMRTGKQDMANIRIFSPLFSISVFLTTMISGCSVTPKPVPIRPDPGKIVVSVGKSQASVGLYLPPELRDYVYHGSVFTYPLVIELGKESADLFRENMKDVFQQV